MRGRKWRERERAEREVREKGEHIRAGKLIETKKLETSQELEVRKKKEEERLEKKRSSCTRRNQESGEVEGETGGMEKENGGRERKEKLMKKKNS